MQDTGSLALVTLSDCAYAIVYVSVSSTSHLKKKVNIFRVIWLLSGFFFLFIFFELT